MRQKLERMGFKPTPLGMRLRLGRVELNTAEGPFGLVIWFQSFSSLSMSQYQITAPYTCSEDAIVALILKNVGENFKHSLDEFTTHFRQLGLTA